MKLLENILLATDLGQSSDNVVDNAIELARTFESKISLVHVLPDDINNEKVKLLLKEAATTQLLALNNRINKEGVKTEEHILEYGNHFDKIIHTADRINANLILIGAGEKEEEEAFQLGTTAEKLIRMSAKPVWVVKKDTPLSVKSILCPVDFSDESKRALKNAIVMARRFESELVIFTVYHKASASTMRINIDWDEQAEFERSEHVKEFDTFLEMFNLTDLNWIKEVQGGDPALNILEAISKHNSDLLVMGTTGKTGLNRFFMGSVTEKVIREVPSSFITLKSEDLIDLKLETRIRDIESHYKTASQLVKDGFLKEAITEYKKCRYINDMHIPSIHGIANVYEKMGRPEKAEKYKYIAKEIMARLWDRKIEAEVRKLYKW